MKTWECGHTFVRAVPSLQLAQFGYLFALSQGPAAIIVPLVATSPALGGLLGAIVVKERLGRLQYAGIGLGLLAAVLLATQG